MTSRYTLEDDDDSRSASPIPHRRNSISEGNTRPNVFLVEVHRTKARLLRQEDTDGDERVTIHDTGPKHMSLPVAQSSYSRRSIKGNYMISSLLQELALLEDLPTEGPKPLVQRSHAVISESQLKENPVDRLNRMISQYFWPALVRRVDADGLTVICMDPKNRSANKRPRVYVPNGDDFAFDYFEQVSKTRVYLDLEVIRLPAIITPEYVCSINDKPGILSLDLERNAHSEVVGKPFIVPGGRFNEMYGWDSYFAALGLLADPSANAVHIAKSMVDNFVYQINHYGKILNANRSYYLLRSQPPFLTDMGLRVHQKLKSAENEDSPISADEWLKGVMMAAIKEYEQVWMDTPRLVEEIGLSRYYSQGQGIPPETEASHFDSHLRPFAEKHGCDIPTFIKMYNDQTIDEPELDEYFCHDRSVRESGHDTTYRLDNCAANLLTVDLCSLLYKYESDISNYIEQSCGGSLRIADKEHLSCDWTAKAERRRELANKYLWNEEKGMYFDYDIIQNNQTTYESATTFWALWSRMASPHQANLLVTKALCRFEVSGGIVSGTKESLGAVSLDRPNRQWDYPTGWAPHQMLAWEGLINYGYSDDARRLVYRWLYMITCAFVDFNGVVPEKFNVVQMSHKVDAEYGNVGTEFKKVPREGFGWMNASYLVGQQYLTKLERRALGALVPLDSLLKNKDS